LKSGDDMMSAIDFNMAIEREPDPKGDRCRITMSGKFLSLREISRRPMPNSGRQAPN
jgi:cyanate lyase